MEHAVGETRVPRALVHKAADAEVLLARIHPRGEGRFAVTAHWPHDHPLHHREADGSRDALIVVETLRQAGICLSHQFFDVPVDHPFILCGFEFDLDAPLCDRRPGGEDAEVVFDITVRCDRPRPGRVNMSAEATVLVDGRPVGRAGMNWIPLPPERYEAVRHRDAARAATAATAGTDGRRGGDEGVVLPAPAVGRDRADAVLLAALPGDPGGWRLRMDTGHPALFDHASDHVPGMVLVEAFRQAALLSVNGSADPDAAPRGWFLGSMRTTFDAFGELGLPVTVTATAAPESGGFLTTATQAGRVLATARLTGASLPLLDPLPRKADTAC
ncbi:ScbA/BarX family gamma-butyrolactone biosynthesis protein [Streptomyces sp. NPDC095613]|uniref:ScbA/BarX family gamma-butyrolactone biosynthesis protein n=1 Tax=Streptomyces sp. NPDC095613 TaxID=3155540 RepID=UPI003328E997